MSQQQPLAIEGHAHNENQGTTTLEVNGMAVKLDALGPVLVNSDGVSWEPEREGGSDGVAWCRCCLWRRLNASPPYVLCLPDDIKVESWNPH